LLGLSGGPDSTALLHLLLECRRFFPIELLIAHVDHHWREESGEEAALLRSQVEKLGLPFYLKSLDGKKWGEGNAEAIAREERLAFFAEIYEKKGCQALLLGHHADDQAETVLKRIFEGASLSALGGLKPVSCWGNMVIWRPLLELSKLEVMEWLQKKGVGWLEDRTNADERYLRARMRKTILPQLEESFGKKVSSNLCRLGQRADTLKTYLLERGAYLRDFLEKGPSGIRWDLRSCLPIEKMEFELIFREMLVGEKIFLSHEQYNLVLELLNAKAANKKVGRVGVDRGVLIII
jgi:tRNA(Ile)-lysidine synthase